MYDSRCSSKCILAGLVGSLKSRAICANIQYSMFTTYWMRKWFIITITLGPVSIVFRAASTLFGCSALFFCWLDKRASVKRSRVNGSKFAGARSSLWAWRGVVHRWGGSMCDWLYYNVLGALLSGDLTNIILSVREPKPNPAHKRKDHHHSQQQKHRTLPKPVHLNSAHFIRRWRRDCARTHTHTRTHILIKHTAKFCCHSFR